MKKIKSYITNTDFLSENYLNYNLQLAHSIDAEVKFVVHSKEIFEPSISPIIGAGLPKLQVVETDKLRSYLSEFVGKNKHSKFKLSPDIFAEIFNNKEVSDNLILHCFSAHDADFVLHNVYSNQALDAAFDNLSPALFIPIDYKFKKPLHIDILLFSEDLGSDFTNIVSLSSAMDAKLNFIIQEGKDHGKTESVLKKITEANNIDFSNLNFSARFVEKIDESLISKLESTNTSENWTVFQHSFLISDLNKKNSSIDMYKLLSESKHPVIIV
jgi:hypothetical protein